MNNPTNPPQGILAKNFVGIGTVTKKMVHSRARELAVINGHSSHAVSKSDWDQAKRELTGEPELDSADILPVATPTSASSGLLLGESDHKTAEPRSEDEDAEGKSSRALLVEVGIKEAAHDQMLQAARTDERR